MDTNIKEKSNTNIFKQLRTKTGLTQSEVANTLNIVTSTVSKWETSVTIPDQSILPKLASLYNCSTDYLLGVDNYVNQDIEVKYNSHVVLSISKEGKKTTYHIEDKDVSIIEAFLEKFSNID